MASNRRNSKEGSNAVQDSSNHGRSSKEKSSLMQRDYADVKDFAAGQAYSEERKRANNQISELLKLSNLNEAQKLLSAMAQEKVEQALFHASSSSGHDKPTAKPADEHDADEPADIAELMAEQRAARRLGITSQVVALQSSINSAREGKQARSQLKEEALLKEKLAEMEERQQARREALMKTQQAEVDKAIETHKAEAKQLLQKQADEMNELVEGVTAMITLGHNWSAKQVASEGTNAPPWLHQLKKHRFRPSKELAEVNAQMSKLGDLSSNSSLMHELQQKAATLEKKERELWKNNVLRSVLGHEKGTVASQVIAAQKLSQAKMRDHHKSKIRALQKSHESAVITLEGQFRLERINVTEGVRSRAKKEELVLDRGSREQASSAKRLGKEKATPALEPTTSFTKRTSSAEDNESEHLVRWKCSKISVEPVQDEKAFTWLPAEALHRLFWLDPEADVLIAILRPESGRALFTRFIDEKDKRAKVNLTYWEQVQACLAIKNPVERGQEALQLHEAHRALAAGASNNRVDSAEALQLLEQKAERLLAKLQRTFLGRFLESAQACTMILEARVKPLDYAALPALDKGPWVSMFAQAINAIPFAIIAVDVCKPGATIAAANPAFEQLTGYEVEWAVGKNCRFLQGENTEQKAVRTMIEHTRKAEALQIELSNYKQDGTAFKNQLSLHPVHDDKGTYKYMIGVLADTNELSADKEHELRTLRRFIPKVMDYEAAAPSAADKLQLPPYTPFCAEHERVEKLLWLQNTQRSMRAMLHCAEGLKAFREHLQEAGDDAEKLDLLLAVIDMTCMARQEEEAMASKVAAKYPLCGIEPDKATPALLHQTAGDIIDELADKHIASFICSAMSDGVVGQVKLDSHCSSHEIPKRLWAKYAVPTDGRNWLFSLVSVVDGLPISVSISDVRVPGLPLIYTNGEFRRLCGYAKEEVLGRNCRFLQGPATEVAAVAQLISALRSGTDCCVRITNYRRSGSSFQNMLNLKFVRDSDDVVRYCVGVQVVIPFTEELLTTAATLLALTPTRFLTGDEAAYAAEKALLASSSTAKPARPGVQPASPVKGEGGIRLANRYAAGVARKPQAPEAMSAAKAMQTVAVQEMREIVALNMKALDGVPAASDAVDVRSKLRFESEHADIVNEVSVLPDRICLAKLYCLSALKSPQIATQLAQLLVLKPEHEFDAALSSDEQLAWEKLRHQEEETLRVEGGIKFVMSHMGAFLELKQGTDFVVQLEESDSEKPQMWLPRGTWLEMFSRAVEHLSFAVVIADVFRPGARLVYVNDAFVELTGYEREYAIGRNCRFLQGKDTDQAAVLTLVQGIRDARPVTVDMINYTKLEDPFLNQLSVHPVIDSNGVYRYSIGVLCDLNSLQVKDHNELARLRRMLPKRFEVSLQPIVLPTKKLQGYLKRAANPRLKDYSAATALPQAQAAVSKLWWLLDLEGGLQKLLEDEQGFAALRRFVERTDEAAAAALDFVLEVPKIGKCESEEEQIDMARQIAQHHPMEGIEIELVTPDQLQQRRSDALRSLAENQMVDFISAKDSDETVQRVRLPVQRGFGSSSHLLWEEYKVPTDAAGWIYSVVGVVDKLPIATSISDMCVAGVPLIYVNEAFCTLTGYSKAEVLGRNCRFLQGPETELSAVREIVRSMRTHTKCSVRINNYRRNGAQFRNLLRMKPIKDFKKVPRYMVAFQFPETLSTASLQKQVGAMIQQIPETFADLFETSLAVKTKIDERDAEVRDVRSNVRYSSEHVRMLKELGAYDPSVFFTRILWLGSLDKTWELLLQVQLFREHFEHFLSERHLAAFDLWRSVQLIQELATVPPGQREERMHELYSKLTGLSSVGKSSLLLKGQLDKEAVRFTLQLKDSVFAEFLGGAACVSFLQAVKHHGLQLSDGLPQVVKGEWLDMISQASALLAEAVLVVDMYHPGALIVVANSAFGTLTGYDDLEWVKGKNCSFLQGPETELDVLQEIVQSLREARPTQVELTNYRKDGSKFRNQLSLQPVRDSNGAYRYSIALITDADALTSQKRAEYERLRHLLPNAFEVELQPLPYGDSKSSIAMVGDLGSPLVTAQRSFAALLWILDQCGTMQLLACYDTTVTTFRQWLEEETHKLALDFWLAAREVDVLLDDETRRTEAARLAELFLSKEPLDDPVARVRKESDAALQLLSEDKLPDFICSPEGIGCYTKLLDSDTSVLNVLADVLDDFVGRISATYQPYPDVVHFLACATRVMDQIPYSVCISDTTIPGNPLVAANDHFSEMTGYSTHESLGRNCRFLQGPLTEWSQVCKIKSHIKSGTEVCVKMRNYRRDGRIFNNLVALKPVHDVNGVMRYIFGFQLEVTDSLRAEENLRRMSRVLACLPSRLPTGLDPPCGHTSPGAERTPLTQVVWLQQLREAFFRPPSDEPCDKCVVFSNDPLAAHAMAEAAMTRVKWSGLRPMQLRDLVLKQLILQGSLINFLHTRSAETLDVLKFYLAHPNPRDTDKKDVFLFFTLLHNHFFGVFIESAAAVTCSHLLAKHHTSGERSWLDMLRETLSELPQAVIVVDMHEPGARIVYANASFETLTGYSQDFAVGRNCRFLQGDETEQEPLHELVTAIRGAKPAVVTLTNYKNDGSKFRNLVGMQPVVDSEGVYRFSIGVHADADTTVEKERERFDRLLSLLPRSFDGTLMPGMPIKRRRPSTLASVAPLPPVVKSCTKLRIFLEPKTHLKAMLSNPELLAAFQQHLSANEHHVKLLDFHQRATKFLQLGPVAQRERVFDDFSKDIEFSTGRVLAKEAAISQVKGKNEQVLSELSLCFPLFVASSLSDALVERTPIKQDKAIENNVFFLWEKYSVPQECAGWLYAVVGAVHELSVAVALTDVCVRSNPLIYVNEAYATLTGYPKSELLGKNARMLQGPATEAAAIAALSRAVRLGDDSCVTATNYSRSGTPFKNCLHMRAVKDSHGVVRYFVAVARNADADEELHAREQAEVARAIASIFPCLIDLPPFSKKVKAPLLQDGPVLVLPPSLNEDAPQPSLNSAEDAAAAAATATAAVATDVEWNECDAYTKLMWSQNMTKKFLKKLLALPRALEHFQAHLREHQHPLICALDFLVMSNQISDLEGPKRRARLFECAESYVKTPTTIKVEEVERRIHAEISNALEMLLGEVFPGFIATDWCTRLIQSLRKVEPPIKGAFLTLPKRVSESAELMDAQQRCVESIIEAVSSAETAILVCDRTLPGLPIIAMSSGAELLMGHTRDDAVGYNCRLMQGPQTDPEAVEQLSVAIRKGEGTVVDIANYTTIQKGMRNESGFMNRVTLSSKLRVTPGETELIFAVLRHIPMPMLELRESRSTRLLLDIFESLAIAREEQQVSPALRFLDASAKALAKGQRWLMDAITTLRKGLRMPVIREILLRSVPNELEASPTHRKQMQDVRLMMHSKNTLKSRYDYIVSTCEFWAELEGLKNHAGWEYKTALDGLMKQYITPELGQRRTAILWFALRKTVYDRWAENERDLVEAEEAYTSLGLSHDELPSLLLQHQFAAKEASQAEPDDDRSASAVGGQADEVLSNASMLQHILVRVISLDVLPNFLRSRSYHETLDELQKAKGSQRAMNASLEAELESLKATLPKTSEEWLGVLTWAARHLPNPVCVCDASLPGMPILCVNTAFEVLTGYESAECVGNSCRFLQGDETDVAAKHRLREAIRNQTGCHLTLLNYKKSGESFMNLLSLTPIFDRDDLCRFYVGSLCEVKEHYTSMKPQLRHADRLQKMLPTKLAVPSAPNVRQRMLRVRDTVMKNGGKPAYSFSAAASSHSVSSSKASS